MDASSFLSYLIEVQKFCRLVEMMLCQNGQILDISVLFDVCDVFFDEFNLA